jgi:hypothetical protein
MESTLHHFFDDRTDAAAPDWLGLLTNQYTYIYIFSQTIQARVTRNIREDPSIPERDVWNTGSVLLEKLTEQEARLAVDRERFTQNRFRLVG